MKTLSIEKAFKPFLEYGDQVVLQLRKLGWEDGDELYIDVIANSFSADLTPTDCAEILNRLKLTYEKTQSGRGKMATR